MTTTRTPPYRHADGSNCWTKNCKLGNTATERESLRKEWFPPTEPKPSATNIDVIAPLSAFQKAVADKRITGQKHPLYPYRIYKYSPQTVHARDWDDITMASRGLIVNEETGEILARPFSKFFNHNEATAPVELMQGPVIVAEKLDGSLGISFMTPEGLQITTAGGFSAEQAAHATALYRQKYEGKWEPREGTTYMWEIIYPENRIVVDYGNEDDIHLLGAVNIKTGKSIPLSQLKEWKWKRAVEHADIKSLDAVLSSPERNNHEGFVVHYVNTDARVKYKHSEYLHHHRYATGITSRKIWENLRNEVDDTEWVKAAPEEFETYINETKGRIQQEFNQEYSRIKTSFNSFKKTLPEGISAKDFAEAVNTKVTKNDRGYFFQLNTSDEIRGRMLNSIWDSIKPPAEKAF